MRSGVGQFCAAALAAATIVVAAGCATRVPDSAPSRLCVSVAPLAEMVGRIAGDQVAVDILVGPGQSPATYEPTPGQMAALEQTQMLFSVGVPFERALLPRLHDLYPNLKVVDLQHGLDLLTFEGGHDDHLDHGHDHGSIDPHVWLDPQLMKKMSSTVAEQLTLPAPQKAADIQRRLQSYQEGLDSLDARMADILAGLSGQSMYVYHPSYGYFARRYGLKQVAVELDGKEPSAQHLVRFTVEAEADRVQAVFVQPQFPLKSAQALAESVGAEVVELDPLAEDYLDNMLRMAHAVAAALGDTKNEAGR